MQRKEFIALTETYLGATTKPQDMANFRAGVKESIEYSSYLKEYKITGKIPEALIQLIYHYNSNIFPKSRFDAYAALRKPMHMLSLLLQEVQQAEEAKALAAAEGSVEQNNQDSSNQDNLSDPASAQEQDLRADSLNGILSDSIFHNEDGYQLGVEAIIEPVLAPVPNLHQDIYLQAYAKLALKLPQNAVGTLQGPVDLSTITNPYELSKLLATAFAYFYKNGFPKSIEGIVAVKVLDYFYHNYQNVVPENEIYRIAKKALNIRKQNAINSDLIVHFKEYASIEPAVERFLKDEAY